MSETNKEMEVFFSSPKLCPYFLSQTFLPPLYCHFFSSSALLSLSLRWVPWVEVTAALIKYKTPVTCGIDPASVLAHPVRPPGFTPISPPGGRRLTPQRCQVWREGEEGWTYFLIGGFNGFWCGLPIITSLLQSNKGLSLDSIRYIICKWDLFKFISLKIKFDWINYKGDLISLSRLREEQTHTIQRGRKFTFGRRPGTVGLFNHRIFTQVTRVWV